MPRAYFIIVCSLAIVVVVLSFMLLKSRLSLIKRPLGWVKKELRSAMNFCIIGLIRVLRKTHEKLNPLTRDEGNLTATDNADRIDVYAPEIKKGLTDPHVVNIAITGSYGAGKSSIIRTFFRKNPEYKAINVSLAAFNAGIKLPKELESIEYSILAQIFYHVKGGAIPFSRFKRIHYVARWKVLMTAIGLFIYGLSIYGLFKSMPPEYLPESMRGLISNYEELFKYGCTVVFSFSSVIILYLLLRLYSVSKLKVKIQDTEVEISPKDSKSAMNKHLDEIEYFFTVTKFDVVILEDLDRFENADIFIKLREISVLVNNSQQVGRKITFIYALRDDIFKDDGRTKFFDKIIPIVPVVNVGNAASHLLNRINGSSNPPICTPTFVKDVSLYIYDMRLLRNIVNEFNIYKLLIKDIEKNSDRLLAMIVYKNKYPTDFSQLQFDQGMVYNLFVLRPLYLQKITEVLREERQQQQERLKRVARNHLASVKELRMICLAAIVERLNAANSQFNVKFGVDIPRTITDMTSDQHFDALLGATQIVYMYYGTSTSRHEFSFLDVEKALGGDFSYAERLAGLMDSEKAANSHIRARIASIDRDIVRARNLTMSEILLHPTMVDTITPLGSDKLLNYLLRHGLINEDYEYYISCFEEGEITKGDLSFIWSLKNRRPLSYEHSLSSLYGIEDRLEEREYDQPAILNVHFFDYMLRTFELIDKRLSNAFRHVFLHQGNVFEFVELYLRTGKQPETFIMALCHFNDNLFALTRLSDIDDSFSNELQQMYMRYGKEEDLLKHANDSRFTKFWASEPWLLLPTQYEFDVEKVINIIEQLNLHFDLKIIPEAPDPEIQGLVITKGLYAMTPTMINAVLMWTEKPVDIHEFSRAQLTHILALNHGNPIREKVIWDFPHYIVNVFLNIDSHDQESAVTILRVLNDPMLDKSITGIVVEKTDFILEESDAIESVMLRRLALQYGRIKGNWHNIRVHYYDKKQDGSFFKFDELLQEFVAKEEIAESLADDAEGLRSLANNDIELLTIFLTSGKFVGNIYEKMLAEVNQPLKDFSFDKISIEQAKLAVGQSKVQIDIDNFTSLLNRFPTLAIQWLEIQIGQFDSKFAVLDLTKELIIKLLQLSKGKVEIENFIWIKLVDSQILELIQAGFEPPSNFFAALTRPVSLPAVQVILTQKTIAIGVKISLLLKVAGDMDDAMLEDSLRKLGEPFSAIVDKDEVPKNFLKSEDANKLLQGLKDSGRIVRTFQEHRKYVEIVRTWDPE